MIIVKESHCNITHIKKFKNYRLLSLEKKSLGQHVKQNSNMELLNREEITISHDVHERTMQIFWTTASIRPPFILKKRRYTQI